ncbi:hypothetical protein GGX14DRAFT_397389 [Mycena pura]|uniref:Uncharacterized protein n=1 Tax=Mycena pura TaxID=153505 RepID=A0AAD6Y8Y6_9AGAR|nr:hypothetical protein GGX14DRAFT_397389 [Mycena pura]
MGASNLLSSIPPHSHSPGPLCKLLERLRSDPGTAADSAFAGAQASAPLPLKEFSPFDLAYAQPISALGSFDVADTLARRIAEQEAAGIIDEPELLNAQSADNSLPDEPEVSHVQPADDTAPRSLLTPAAGSSKSRHLKHGAPTDLDYKKASSRHRQEKKRTAAQQASGMPGMKGVHVKHRTEAMLRAVQVDSDVSHLPHSKPAWIGSRTSKDLKNGLGDRNLSKEEVFELTGEEGFMYINWLGQHTIPIIERCKRVVAVLGGGPRDSEGWREVTEDAARLMASRASRLRCSTTDCHHQRAQVVHPSSPRFSKPEVFQEPGELDNSKANKEVVDELLAHESFKRLSGWTNLLFRTFAPLLRIKKVGAKGSDLGE